MSGGGGKGGSQTQTQQVELPAWVNQAGQENVRLAREISKIGPILEPSNLPTLAAQTPLEMASMANTGSAASAFGLASPELGAGMPVPTQFAGGITGYSAAPMVRDALSGWQAEAPAQYDFVRSFWNDPVNGPRSMNASVTPSAAPSSAPISTLTDAERRAGLTEEMKARGMGAADLWR